MKSDKLVFDKANSVADQRYVNDTVIKKFSKIHDEGCFHLDNKLKIQKKDIIFDNDPYPECLFNSENIDESFESRSVEDGYVSKKGIEFASQKIKKRPKSKTSVKYKELIAKFDNSITKRRNLDTNTIVRNLCKHEEKGNLFKLDMRDNYHIDKFLKLRKLNITYINPVTETRYMDYIFP